VEKEDDKPWKNNETHEQQVESYGRAKKSW
jgi:hypothetical protein